MCRFVQLLTPLEALKLRLELAENLGREVTWRKQVRCYRCLDVCSPFSSFLSPGEAPGPVQRGFWALMGPKAVRGLRVARQGAGGRKPRGPNPRRAALLQPAAHGAPTCHSYPVCASTNFFVFLNILLAPVMSLGDLNPSFTHVYF